MDSTTVDRVVDALIGAGLLEEPERRRGQEVVALSLAIPEPGRPGLPRLVEVVAYVGGALVLAAGGLFVAEQWDQLGFAVRVALLGVVSVALALAGGVAARATGGREALLEDRNDGRRRLGGTLLVGAALAAAFLAGFVLDHELVDGPELPSVYWPAVVAGVVMLLASAVAHRTAPTAVAQVGMLGGAMTAFGNAVEGWENGTVTWLGVAFLALGVAWLVLAESGLLTQLTVARSLGVALTLLGAQLPVAEATSSWVGYLLTVVVVAAGLGLYLARVAWPYLAVAVVAVTLVVPEMVTDWTEGSLGAVGGVLVAGLTLLVASLTGYRIRAETTD